MQLPLPCSLRRIVRAFSALLLFVLAACSGLPAGRSEAGLELETFHELSPGTVFVFSPGDSDEYTRRITAAAGKMYRPGKVFTDTVELVLHTRLQQREDMSPGFISKIYEIHLEGELRNLSSERIGILEGRLEYRRSRLRQAVADEGQQYDEWDQDFVDWSAGKILEALTF